MERDVSGASNDPDRLERMARECEGPSPQRLPVLPCDYTLTDGQADALSAVAAVPVEFRRKLLSRISKSELVEMFAQFVGMANSVVANNREMVELLLIINGDHPHSAEKANLPTIMGALWGAKLANAAATDKVCGGCAYRVGTPANQSPVTTCDADWCDNDGRQRFMCHEDLDDKGEPLHVCRGHGRVAAGKRRDAE